MKSILAAAALGAAVVVGGSADATIYNVAVAGKVVGGWDYQALFGPAYGSLDNVDFSARIVYDDQTPGSVPWFAENSITGDGASDPLTITLTINGHDYVYPRHHGLGSINRFQWFFSEYQVVDGHLEDSFTLSLNNLSGAMPAAPAIGQSLTFPVNSGGFPQTGIITQQTSFRIDNGRSSQSVAANLRPTTLTISATSSVPEPASWASLLLGLMVIGHALRSPRRPQFQGWAGDARQPLA